jgi:UPF0755 protein
MDTYSPEGGHRAPPSVPPRTALLYPFIGVVSVFLLSGAFFYAGAVRPPSKFPPGTLVTISPGMTLSEAATFLKEKQFVRSSFWFVVFVHLRGEGGRIIAGDYFFKTKKTSIAIARMLNGGESGLTPERVTIPEGWTAEEISKTLAARLPAFSEIEFARLSRGKEGYLFPDTYFFFPNEGAGEVLKKLEGNFVAKIKSVGEMLQASGKPPTDIITMASILEKEAATTEDRRMIAGILWKRLKIGMPLQVDAAFLYINGKNTYELTEEDLALDSPYNTYRYRGLPPTPIGNPGLDSVVAAAMPIESNYLYYLSDLEGKVHYSETFEEHKEKKALYIP